MSTPQPDSFAFTSENARAVDAVVAKYPPGREQSAVLPLLLLAQEQHENWLPRAAMDHVAGVLGMAPIRVYEVATFYTMLNLEPVGHHHVRVCTTTPCWLRGSDQVVDACRRRLHIDFGETTADRMFTLDEVECLAACVNAPVAWIGDEYYEDLDADSITRVLDELAAGGQPAPGSQTQRQRSAPAGRPRTLLGTA